MAGILGNCLDHEHTYGECRLSDSAYHAVGVDPVENCVPLPNPSFGSCYSLADSTFHLMVVNNGAAGYIGYDIYGVAPLRNLGYFKAGETRNITESQEGTLRKFVSPSGQNWQRKGGTHTLNIQGHISNGYVCEKPDLNDGVVDMGDLVAIANHFGEECAP